MLADAEAFSGFAVDDLDKAKEFYGETLGLNVELLDEGPGLLTLHLKDGRDTLIYRKEDNQPANHTILNFRVDEIETTVDALTAAASSSSATTTSIRTTEESCTAHPAPTSPGSRTRPGMF